jgi:hypothetical protein
VLTRRVAASLREQRFHLALESLRGRVAEEPLSRWMAEGARSDLESLARRVDGLGAADALAEPASG